MASFFDVLFSVQAKHDYYPTGISKDLVIEPTFECQKLMKRLGLLYKAKESGGLIIIERIGETRDAAQPLRPIKKLAGFTFLLTLKDASLLKYTKPYGRKKIIREKSIVKEVKYEANALPEFVGRTRILYFDNLEVDGSNKYIISNRLQLSDIDQVDLDDFGSVIPNKFNYPAKGNPTSTVNVSEIKPNGITRNFDRENGILKPLELPIGAYWTEESGNNANEPEVLFADTGLLSTRALGIIQVFIDENTINVPEKHYEINFKKDIEITT